MYGRVYNVDRDYFDIDPNYPRINASGLRIIRRPRFSSVCFILLNMFSFHFISYSFHILFHFSFKFYDI